MIEPLQQKIRMYLQDELRDETKYRDLANELKNECPKYSKIFTDLSKEEKSHAVIIDRIIKELNI